MSVLVGGLLPQTAAAYIETHTCGFFIDLDSSAVETYVTIPLFDRPASQYQLDSVYISMTGTMSYELAVENETYDFPVSVSGQVGYMGDVTIQGVPSIEDDYWAVLPFDLASPDGNPRSGPDYCYAPSVYDIFYDSGEDEPASWEGSGDKYVWIRATKSWYQFLSPDNASIAVYEGPLFPHVEGTLSVEYSYSVIPEPATLSLLAMGTLAVMRRSQRGTRY
jgi:hypothetical protein